MLSPDSVQSVEQLVRLRALLVALEDPAMAALLRELGAVLYNREVQRWRILVDISDELLDVALAPARLRLTERMLTARRPLTAARPRRP